MTIPKRFALSTLLLSMLVVASIFGYAQWRKQWLLREVKTLNMSGSLFTSLQFTNGIFWPYVTGDAVVVLQRNDDGTFMVDKKSVGVDEAEAFLKETTNRLHAIGVEKVSYALMMERGLTRYPAYFHLQSTAEITKDIEAIELESMQFK